MNTYDIQPLTNRSDYVMICLNMDTKMTPDQIREKILRALHRIYTSARSRDSQLVGIRDLSAEVKTELPEIKEKQVFPNTEFLVQNGYVEEVEVKNFYAESKFGNSKPSIKYRLSKDGLAYFEHGSKFDKSSVFAGIGDITGDGNTIVIGNRNNITSLASAQYEDGHRLTEDLRRHVNALGELSDDQKISVQSDLETIKSQLAKQQPDVGILQKAKDNIAFLADIVAVATPTAALITWLSTQFHF